MTSAIINKEKRKKEGLPELKVSRRGTIYTSPKEIISSKKGQELIEKLSKFDFKGKKLTNRKI